MKRKVRVQLVLGVCATFGCALLLLAARKIALAHLPPETAIDPHQVGSAARHLRYQFRALFILSTIGSFVAGWGIGARVMIPFERLRAELMAGSLGSIGADDTSAAWSADAHEMKHAVLRHETRLLHRTSELARETADLKQLLNAVSEGLMQIDNGSRILQANPAALHLLGIPHGEVGQSLVSLIRHVELRNFILQAATGQIVIPTEISFDDRRLLLSATPIPVAFENENVAPSAVLAIADLTQLRQLEGVRRDFVANVSHELKTPLTSIHGYSETLLQDTELAPETRRAFLDTIHRNAIRLQRIVDDLLDLSRVESGAWSPELQEVRVADIVQDVWLGCEDLARKKQVVISYDVGSQRVLADEHGFRQVVSNLLDNALRYTQPGGTIDVSLAREMSHASGEQLVGIAFRDTGIGIPREAIGRIFERFYRVDPARSRAEGGTGLGLSIVKHMVDSMQGAVTAESELGIGTTITVWLPSA